MRAATGWAALSFLALTMVPELGGCAAAPVAVAGASSGISFSTTSTTAYRCFTYSEAQVHAAVLKALGRMQITKIRDKKIGDDIKITGKTRHLRISIALVTVTPAVTKVSVNAKKNWFMKDQTVAVEILIQINQVLTDQVYPPR